MAEENEENKEAEQAPATSKKKSKTVLIASIAGVLVLLIAIAVPVVIFMTKGVENESLVGNLDHSSDITISEEGYLDEDERDEGEDALGALFPLDTFVVNLAGGGFIRIQVQLEFTTRDIPRRFYTRLVPLRDAIIGVLASKRKEDVSNGEGRESLKAEIRELANDLIRKENVKEVYFTQLVIQ